MAYDFLGLVQMCGDGADVEAYTPPAVLNSRSDYNFHAYVCCAATERYKAAGAAVEDGIRVPAGVPRYYKANLRPFVALEGHAWQDKGSSLVHGPGRLFRCPYDEYDPSERLKHPSEPMTLRVFNRWGTEEVNQDPWCMSENFTNKTWPADESLTLPDDEMPTQQRLTDSDLDGIWQHEENIFDYDTWARNAAAVFPMLTKTLTHSSRYFGGSGHKALGVIGGTTISGDTLTLTPTRWPDSHNYINSIKIGVSKYDWRLLVPRRYYNPTFTVITMTHSPSTNTWSCELPPRSQKYDTTRTISMTCIDWKFRAFPAA